MCLIASLPISTGIILFNANNIKRKNTLPYVCTIYLQTLALTKQGLVRLYGVAILSFDLKTSYTISLPSASSFEKNVRCATN